MLDWFYPCPHLPKYFIVCHPRPQKISVYPSHQPTLVCVHSPQTIVSSRPLLHRPHFVWITQSVFQVSDNTEQAKSKFPYLKSWSYFCIQTCFLVNHLIWSRYHRLNQIKTREFNWKCLSILPPSTWLNNHVPVKSLYFQPFHGYLKNKPWTGWKYILPTGPWLFNHGTVGSLYFQPYHG